MGVFEGDEGAGNILEEERYKRPTLLGRFLLPEERRTCMPAFMPPGAEGLLLSRADHEPAHALFDVSLVFRQLGFDVNMAEGKFRVPVDRWEALRSLTDSIFSARCVRV